VEPAFLSVVLALVIFFVFTLGLRADKAKERRENATWHQGQEALKSGDFDLALSCGNEEIRRDPKRGRGHAMRGEALHRKGMHTQAIEAYNQAIRLAPGVAGYYRLRADSFAALRLHDKAIADYSDAIRLDPANTKAIEGRKSAYAEKEALGDATPDDLPSESAIVTELPIARNDGESAPFDSYQVPRPSEGPVVALVTPAKVFNPLALTGFILGLVSVVLYVIGIIPILGIVFSAIGLARFNPETQKAKWMAGWGLALSILFTVMYLTRH
jgi:tetratricopeptide (TPR) repeat protein